MKFKSQGKQLEIDEFKSSLQGLNKSNRWVKLGDSMPWAEIEILYNSKLGNNKRGAGNKPARMIIGALIIKHKMNLSDEETIYTIQENPYMQYFLGLSEFTDKPIFDSSLFVTIRKRLGTDDFNEMSLALLLAQLEKAKSANQSDKTEKSEKDDNNNPNSSSANQVSENESQFTDSQGRKHQGSLKIDATCADAEVRYPTDIDLLHDSSRVINRLMSKLCKNFSLQQPNSHYKQARKSYLEVIKRKKKSKKLINNGKLELLAYLGRDIHSFVTLIATNGTQFLYKLRSDEQRLVGSIIKVYHQQKAMFKDNARSCPNRIISIFQAHLRPIVRGKAKSMTEFGAKIGASITNGFTFIDHHSWDAYNESSDLELQIQLFEKRFGYLPAKLYADKIYLNKANRQLLKAYEIEVMGTPLGRPSAESKTKEARAKQAKIAGERNEIEATFGTAKRVYKANDIRAKLPETANSWTGMCYLVKNVMEFLRRLLHALFLITVISKIYGKIRITILPDQNNVIHRHLAY